MISFTARGHRNIVAEHKTTLEFTRDKEVTEKGDCILGVDCDFRLEDIRRFIESAASDNIRITIKADDITEEITATLNKNFNSRDEIVIRKTDFSSERTLGILADKGAGDINRKIALKLADKAVKAHISISTLE